MLGYLIVCFQVLGRVFGHAAEQGAAAFHFNPHTFEQRLEVIHRSGHRCGGAPIPGGPKSIFLWVGQVQAVAMLPGGVRDQQQQGALARFRRTADQDIEQSLSMEVQRAAQPDP